jgi:O-acetylhomoserine (thiol)-lyase
MAERTPGFDTLALHAGQAPDPATGARITPIYQTTAYVFNDVQHASDLFALRAFGNIYTRIMNPTQGALEGKVTALEGGTASLAVASGHAAQLLAFHTIMQPGDEFVAARQLYGGSINQFAHSFKSFGFIESISNPGGRVTDIAGVAKIAQKAGIPLIVDNTLATPYLCKPFEHGANIVLHSLTKFMGGHGNSMGGVIVDGGNFDWSKSGRYPLLSEPNGSYHGLKLHETFGNIAFAIAARVLGLRDLGPSIAPLNAFLILTGMETLGLRMQRHCENALKVAQWLKKHPNVSWVNYASLPDDKYHALAQKYCPKGAGAVFTFGLKGGYDAGVKAVSSVKMLSHLANIGDTRSLIIHPASTTHSQLNADQLKLAGATPDVVRLSIGLEDVADIIADLDQAIS